MWPSLLSSVLPATGPLPKADALLMAGALGGAGIRHLRLPEHSETVMHVQLSIFMQRCKPCKGSRACVNKLDAGHRPYNSYCLRKHTSMQSAQRC